MIAALVLLFSLDPTHHVRVYASHPLDVANARITRALVVIHGSGRNADRALATATAAAERAHALDSTILIAPRFVSNDGRDCTDTIAEGEVNWGCEANNGWQAGGTATDSDALTTFDVVDRLLRELARVDRFPNLSRIVVAGHSAGGQFVTRYEMANQVHDRLRVPVEYVVASPSSYAYPDAVRPASHGPPSAGCSIFDDWPYGLRDRRGYARRSSADQLARQLTTRPVTYLLGALDNDPAMRGLDTTCAAAVQGASRLERGQVFAQHLASTYRARPRVVIVPGCAHDDRCVFTSDAARAVLFAR
jgi:hypothetical protein